MKHVSEHGWSTEALRSGAIELNLSPAMVGQVPNGVGSMVRHFCDNCDSRLSVKLVLELDELMNGDFSQQMSPSQKLATVIKWRLDMLKPVIDTWPQALAIQAAPKNAAATATRVALLADELVSAMGPDGVGLTRVTRAITAPDQLPIPPEDVSGDDTQKDDSSNYSSKKEEEVKPTSSPFAALSSLGWYADRAAVGALYQACEVFMVADTSPGFQDTYDFVDTRCADLARFSASAEEIGSVAAAAAKGFKGAKGFPIGFNALPELPKGSKQVMESVFAKVIEVAMSSRGGKR